jgi:hypothetical protein
MVELKKQKIRSKVHQGHHLVLCNLPVLILQESNMSSAILIKRVYRQV